MLAVFLAGGTNSVKTYPVAAVVVVGGKKTKQDVHRLLVGCTDSVKTYPVDVFVAAKNGRGIARTRPKNQ